MSIHNLIYKRWGQIFIFDIKSKDGMRWGKSPNSPKQMKLLKFYCFQSTFCEGLMNQTPTEIEIGDNPPFLLILIMSNIKI